MTGILCAIAGSGGVLDIQTVTVGRFTGCDKYGCYTHSGYFTRGADIFGSISDGTFNPVSGASIVQLACFSGSTLRFTLSGIYSNGGWTSMQIGSNIYTRDSATFSASGSYTDWQWATAASPFGADGTISEVTFR